MGIFVTISVLAFQFGELDIPDGSLAEPMPVERVGNYSSQQSDNSHDLEDDSVSTAEENSQSAQDKDSQSSGSDFQNDDSEMTSDTAENQQPVSDIQGEISPSLEQTDYEYFTTTIKDGETVNQKNFSFEINQLEPSLTLISRTVTVNGSEVMQFSGSCLLSEGENLIRIACTYTDSENAVLRFHRDYRVFCYAGEIGFETNIQNCETHSSEMEFFARAFYDKKEIPITVTLNGRGISGEILSLSEGENIVTLSAQYKGRTAEKKFTITYKKQAEGFYTNLSDCQVYSPQLEFYAYIQTDDGRGKLTCAVNGENIRSEGDNFKCRLNVGENVIRIKGRGGNVTCDEQYIVRYIPNDEKLKPVLASINLKDGQRVKGTAFSLTLRGEDCDKKRIYANRIAVSVGGSRAVCKWENSEESGYLLTFKEGENQVTVRLTDSQGRYRDYFYKVTCESLAAGEKIGTCLVSLDAKTLGLSLSESGEVSICQGETALDVAKKFLEQKGYQVEVTSTGYLSRIKKKGAFANVKIPQLLRQYLTADGISIRENGSPDSLGEYDYTSLAGWVYSVGGKVPNYGINQAYLSDGDSLRITFTLCSGRDITGAENCYENTW